MKLNRKKHGRVVAAIFAQLTMRGEITGLEGAEVDECLKSRSE